MAGAALIGTPAGHLFAGIPAAPTELYALSSLLLEQWAAGLLSLQVTDSSRVDDYGGIWCPADKAVHGRSGDAIYPFFHLAAKTKNKKYTDAALLLYRWMDRRVSQPDGSWLNEPQKGSWQGTTVFSAISLAETLKNHGALMDPSFKEELRVRLKAAGDFIYNNFTIEYGNINYPISASYGLLLLGEVLDVPKFKVKGRALAHDALRFISTKDGFITGEGDPYHQPSKKGCFSVDLGYNVEESLPELTMYGLLAGDEEVLQAVTRSLRTHMEFMLPDGGWDNSWGTRNYKWTYWGSRTSDGCQTAYALLAARDPAFYKVALQNTRLLQQGTKEGLLTGGPHALSHGIPTCVHHTFSHSKALTTILDHGDSLRKPVPASLPREKSYGARFFSDIQTWLLSKGDYRATVTGYDREYKKFRNGHASGGALTMLWHPKTGPLLVASMNEYQLFEAGNMQADKDPHSMPLTPRIEWKTGGLLYMNISDLDATIEVEDSPDQLAVHTRSRLVDKDQKNPPAGEINCRVSYLFTKEKCVLSFQYDPIDAGQQEGQPGIIFPLISATGEPVEFVDDRSLKMVKAGSQLMLSADQPLVQLPTSGGRIFNFVPGLEAIPLYIRQNKAVLEIKVHSI